MKYIELFGNSITDDINVIKKTINEDSNTVFVFSGEEALYDYIENLYNIKDGLDAEYLYKFKVCYEKKKLQVTYSSRNEKQNKEIRSMSSLINELDGKKPCRIVVENNNRVELAFIVQQLIFIEYPLENVDILLRKEERDADKTKRFMKNVDNLLNDCEVAIGSLCKLKEIVEAEIDDGNPTKGERIKDIDDALDSCTSIKCQILKSKAVELKFAVAATKKAGKSVIVNCFLGEEVAPTSTELATPNNCFYKKSPDTMYHLQLGEEATLNFDSREEIYDEINKRFREAQNDKEQGFALPDMNIKYVTSENNFSTYTIFDTAGPDAAGTAHADVAEKAMQKCDVAVFAIDYAKYLTTSEENYLRRVKEMFTNGQKFHSLIFALNKIDVRYTDPKSAKSFVKSVDFLKTRLAKIDEAYKDCIIFPTCSKEYFHAIEAEKAGITELNSENNLPIEKMRDIKFAHRDIEGLAWLHTHSENLEYFHGIKTISYDIFKKDSGMPALMSYVSYVAQSKARDEIVNSITSQIDTQKRKISSVLDFIANIEALINADDEKIGEIAKIINDYSDSVQAILNDKFKQDELDRLNDGSLLKQAKGDYSKFIENQSKAIDAESDDVKIAEVMYAQMVEIIWNKVKSAEDISGKQIDNLFSTSDFKNIANKIGKQNVEEAAKRTHQQLSKLSKDVKDIVDFRQEQLKMKSNECRERLKKEHISIELPELPAFEFATQIPSPSEVIVNVEGINFNLSDRLSSLFEKKFFPNIGVFFRNFFGRASEKDYKHQLTASKKTFVSTCDRNIKDSIENAVFKNHIAKGMQDTLKQSVVEGYMKSLINEIKQTFYNMNYTQMDCINRFRSAVDDRDKYKNKIEQYNLRKDNIRSIGEYTNKFMNTWESIILDIAEDEENETEAEKNPALV
jgi:hypothetical protein